MKRLTATIAGAVAGLVVAAFFMAFFGSVTALETVDAVPLIGGRARPMFQMTTGAFYLLTIFLGLIAGALIALVIVALSKERRPEEADFPFSALLPMTAVLGGLLAYTAMRAGIGAAGSIETGVITISVFRMLVTTAVAGAVIGAIIGWTSDALVNPAFLGLEGVAWPKSRAEFIRAAMGTMLPPFAAIIAMAVVAVILAQILLAAAEAFQLGAVVVASVLAALVLAGASALAYRPMGSNEDTDAAAPQ